jgi:thioredoxin 1
MRKWIMVLVVYFLFAVLFLGPACSKEGQDNLPQVPTEGMVTMLDLGAKKCIPCKMMAPILEKLKREYKGKASIIFIDVWVHREEPRKYGIRAIPTQIFFDKNGKEVCRHVGFMSEEEIIRQLKKMGVNKDETGLIGERPARLAD